MERRALTERKLGFIQPFSEEAFDRLSAETIERAVRDIAIRAAEKHGIPVEDSISWEFVREAVIDGLRLFPEDEEGNPIPEMVCVRGTIQVLVEQEN